MIASGDETCLGQCTLNNGWSESAGIAQVIAGSEPWTLIHLLIVLGVLLMLAGLFNMSFAGLPFLLHALAVAFGSAFPHWLGWLAAVAGAGSVAAGLFQAITGEPTIASLVLTVIGPMVVCLWLLVMGILLSLRSPDSERTAPRAYPQEAQRWAR